MGITGGGRFRRISRGGPRLLLPARACVKSWNATFGPACSIPMLSRAQWYREQANWRCNLKRATRTTNLNDDKRETNAVRALHGLFVRVLSVQAPTDASLLGPPDWEWPPGPRAFEPRPPSIPTGGGAGFTLHVGGLLKLCERPVTRRIRSRIEGSIPTVSFAPWAVRLQGSPRTPLELPRPRCSEEKAPPAGPPAAWLSPRREGRKSSCDAEVFQLHDGLCFVGWGSDTGTIKIA